MTGDANHVKLVTDQIEKPLLDNRSYRVIRLPNKIEAFLVHDPEADKASAALDVNVGSFSDDEDMPGMAHAVEHLLFMGTKKFPVENEYLQYLSNNAGSCNSYTGGTSTVFFFGVSAKPANDQEPSASNPSPFKGALDRFAQFFIEPLFLESTIDRELRVVDSENSKNRQNDLWRLRQLLKSSSNPNHPFCHFPTGNLDVLQIQPEAKGINVRKKFIEFHEKHYSANRMKLVVLGRERLDVLEDWVAKFFAGVPNKNLAPNRWDREVPFRESELGYQTFAKPVMELRELRLFFPFLDQEEMCDSRPSLYISDLIGHEGPGSIMAYLKMQGWANEVWAIAESVCPGSPDIFSCQILLTKDGLENYKEVVKLFFQYVSLLREAPPQEWIFDEQKHMADVDFKFEQEAPAIMFTSKIVSVMQTPLPREWLLSSRLRRFDSQLIEEGLACLRPDNFCMIITSQKFPGVWDQKERWYGTEYRHERISDDFMADLKEAAPSPASKRLTELHLPHKNDLIPTKFEVEKIEVKEPALCPRLIRNDSLARTWFKKDDTFWVPRANLMISFRNPHIHASAENAMKARLFTDLVTDALEECSYKAKLAGLQYTVTSDARGLLLKIGGYDDKLTVLLEQILTTMRDLKIEDERFGIIKERLVREYHDWELQEPISQVSHYTLCLNSERAYVVEAYLTELPNITAADVRQFKKNILAQLHIESYVHGNLYREDALKLTDTIATILRPNMLPQAQWPVIRSLVIPPGSNYIFKKTLKNPANVNSCVEIWLHLGDKSDRHVGARAMLLGQMCHEPAFTQLRTKEQLGYSVFSGVRECSTTHGFTFTVQSERTPEHVESRIEAFLNRFSDSLESMSNAEFEAHKHSLMVKRLEKPKNLGQESSRHWGEIADANYDFERAQRDATHIETLTKADMIDFFEEYIKPGSPTRAKVSVHLLARAAGKSVNLEANSHTPWNGNCNIAGDSDFHLIEDIQSFRAGLQATEGAKPTQDLQRYADIERRT